MSTNKKQPTGPCTNLEDVPVMMTVEEFGSFLRVSRNTAYAYVRAGIVPTVKVGRQIRIYRDPVFEPERQDRNHQVVVCFVFRKDSVYLSF